MNTLSDPSTLESKVNSQPEFRLANSTDLVFIGRLLREFYGRAGHVYGIPFDYESCLLTVDDVITRGICIVGPSSCAGASLAFYPMNHHFIVARVEFWYFRRKREIMIFEKLRTVCRAAGATHIAAFSHFPENKAARFYSKIGLHPVEIGSIGEIKYGKPRN